MFSPGKAPSARKSPATTWKMAPTTFAACRATSRPIPLPTIHLLEILPRGTDSSDISGNPRLSALACAAGGARSAQRDNENCPDDQRADDGGRGRDEGVLVLVGDHPHKRPQYGSPIGEITLYRPGPPSQYHRAGDGAAYQQHERPEEGLPDASVQRPRGHEDRDEADEEGCRDPAGEQPEGRRGEPAVYPAASPALCHNERDDGAGGDPHEDHLREHELSRGEHDLPDPVREVGQGGEPAYLS